MDTSIPVNNIMYSCSCHPSPTLRQCDKVFREIPWFLTQFIIYRMEIVTHFRVAGSITGQDAVCKSPSNVYM